MDDDSGVELYKGGNKPKKADLVSFVMDRVNICNYYDRTYVEKNCLWKNISEKDFSSICYAVFGAGIPSAHVRDLEHYFMSSHNIIEAPSRLIAFGNKIWDMNKCDFVDEPISKCFFRSEYTPNMNVKMRSNWFVEDLACKDMNVYDDIMYTLSIMFSSQKPDLVGFFYGDGKNGKSVLMDVMRKIIGNHISSINLERLTDQRDAPLINGTLANLCGENADNIVIEDSQVYKSIGSHEDWSVHRMHTNESIAIDTNPVHVFCVNNMPNFKDKSSAIIRRARIVPFKNKFVEDSKFKENLYANRKFMSDFLGELLLYCQDGKKNNWKNEISESTQKEIDDYELLRNSSKTFIDEYIDGGLVGFKDFVMLGNVYSNWCKANGYTEMGVKTFRNSVMKRDFKRKSGGDNAAKVYMLDKYDVSNTRFSVGLYYSEDNVEESNEPTTIVTQEILDLFK